MILKIDVKIQYNSVCVWKFKRDTRYEDTAYFLFQLVNENWFRRFETRKREKRSNSYFWFLKLLYIDNVIIFRLYFVFTFHLLWFLKICKWKYTVIYTIYCYSLVKRNMLGELFDSCLSHTWYYKFLVLFFNSTQRKQSAHELAKCR